MTYLGALLAQARLAAVGPGEGAPASLRPVLPARFEPDAPPEVTTTVEAPGLLGTAPSSTSGRGPDEPRRERLAQPDRGQPSAEPVLPTTPRGDPDRPATEWVRQATREPDPSTPERVVVDAPVRDEHPIGPEARALAPSPHGESLADVARGSDGERHATVRADELRVAPGPREPAIAAPTPAPAAILDAAPLRPAAGQPEAHAIDGTRPREAPTGIRVSIGRLEVRAPAAPPAVPASPRWSPRLTLDDYLRERSR